MMIRNKMLLLLSLCSLPALGMFVNEGEEVIAFIQEVDKKAHNFALWQEKAKQSLKQIGETSAFYREYHGTDNKKYCFDMLFSSLKDVRSSDPKTLELYAHCYRRLPDYKKDFEKVEKKMETVAVSDTQGKQTTEKVTYKFRLQKWSTSGSELCCIKEGEKKSCEREDFAYHGDIGYPDPEYSYHEHTADDYDALETLHGLQNQSSISE